MNAQQTNTVSQPGYHTLCNYYNTPTVPSQTKTPAGTNFYVVPVFGMRGYDVLSKGGNGSGYFTLPAAYRGSDQEQEYVISRCS